mgnify:CR=1 FL=1
MRTKPLLVVLALFLAATACSNPAGNGEIVLYATHEVDGQPLATDTLAYTNMADNLFLINEVQYFLSNITLEDQQGNCIHLADMWYVDTNIPESQTLKTKDVPVGTYVLLRLTFGLNDADNLTGIFSNPPESNMFWPDELGGGYHYMKLNGRYLNADSLLAPLTIHLGRGQNAELTEFYDNSFVVELPINLTVSEDQESPLHLVMNIDRWFSDPHWVDLNTYGSAIMQNQEAQRVYCENGHNVFTIKTTDNMRSPLNTTMELLHKAAPKPHFMTWENLKNTFTNIKNTKNL